MSKEGRIALLVNLVCCATILLMSVGYSNFSKKLTSDEIAATVRIEKEIRVNNIALSSTSNGAISNWEEYNFDNIEGRVVLPSETSEIIYIVDILNLSNKEYGILSITGLTEELDYELIDYNLEEKICEGSKCTLGVTKPIKIKIKYKEGMFNPSKNEYNFKLDFDFRTYHKINYVDIPSTGLPTEIIDGGVYNQTIAPEFSRDIEVKCGELVLVKNVDYIYNDNKLVINTTNDDITITNLKYQVGDYIKLGTEGFYVISADESTDTLRLLAEWNLNVGNNTIASAPVGMQNESCKGKAKGLSESEFHCVIDFSETNYWSSTVLTYPAFVYDSNSNLYTHVENYINELEKFGYNILKGRLITYKELVSLGCPETLGSCSGPSWLWNTTYWTGSANNSTDVWGLNSSGVFGSYINNYSHNINRGLRPVIFILASEI